MNILEDRWQTLVDFHQNSGTLLSFAKTPMFTQYMMYTNISPDCVQVGIKKFFYEFFFFFLSHCKKYMINLFLGCFCLFYIDGNVDNKKYTHLRIEHW